MSRIPTEKYHATSHSTASAAERTVRFMKSEGNLTLLAAVDKLIQPENYAQFLIGQRGELFELLAELNKTPFNPEKFVGELNDVMVFVYSWYIAHGIQLDLSDIPYKRNQKGKRSDVVEVLEGLAWEYLSDPKAGMEIVEITTSMMFYADIPGPKYHLYQNFHETVGKVLANRRREFYGDTDYFTGRKLSEDQVQAKYHFNEKVFRTIRDARPNPDIPLSDADIFPWKEYLFGWNVPGMLAKFFQDFAEYQKNRAAKQSKVLVWTADHQLRKAA